MNYYKKNIHSDLVTMTYKYLTFLQAAVTPMELLMALLEIWGRLCLVVRISTNSLPFKNECFITE